MQKGNVNWAIRLLTNNWQGGVFPLNEETINMLRQKNSKCQEPNAEFLLQGPEPKVELIIFYVIDEAMVLKIVYQRGTSGLDGNGSETLNFHPDH